MAMAKTLTHPRVALGGCFQGTAADIKLNAGRVHAAAAATAAVTAFVEAAQIACGSGNKQRQQERWQQWQRAAAARVGAAARAAAAAAAAAVDVTGCVTHAADAVLWKLRMVCCECCPMPFTHENRSCTAVTAFGAQPAAVARACTRRVAGLCD